MQLLVATVLAGMAFVIAIGLDLGGTVATLIFLTGMLIGAIIRAWAPLITWLRGPAAER
jgi:hypothetical protein